MNLLIACLFGTGAAWTLLPLATYILDGYTDRTNKLFAMVGILMLVTGVVLCVI